MAQPRLYICIVEQLISLTMQTIDYTDVVFATIIQRGRTLYSARISGMSSVAEVMKYLHSAVGKVAGMVTLNLRNSSQGWSTQTYLRIQRPAA